MKLYSRTISNGGRVALRYAWLWLGCLAFASIPVHAKVSQVTLAIELVGSEEATPALRTVAVQAEAISKTGEERSSDLRFEGLEVPGTSVLGLDDEHVWKVALDASGLWAPPRIVGLGERSLRLRAWPTARLTGALAVPDEEEAPGELTARFESTVQAAEGNPTAISKEEVSCPVEAGRFVCEVPAGELDLRLRAKGFVSHYRWGVQIDAGSEHDLGSLRLRPGASVVGSVVVADGRLSPERCTVALAPATAAGARTPSEQRRRVSASLETSVTDEGFFHFEGVAPGAYRLSVSHPGYAKTELSPVAVVPRSETAVQRPLLLQRPVDLEVFLEPPTDVYGEAWRLEVARKGRVPGTLDMVAEGSADLAGTFLLSGLDPGELVVSVYDSHGSRFAWEDVELSREAGPLFVRLEVIWTEGVISLGDEPLEGTLTFGGRTGTNRIVMLSDEDGTFGGFLPKPGEWDVFVESEAEEVSRTVEVEVVADDQGTAALEIELPDTEIAGEVVDDRRRAVEGAVVKVAHASTGAITWRTSDADGEFRFRGLPEGTTVVDAVRGEELASDAVVMQIGDDAPQPHVTLVLREKAVLHGRVLSSSGPVPGALVLVIPKRGGIEQPFARRPHGVTDPTGRFTVRVPAEADRLEVVLMPPGYALTTRVLSGLPDEPVELAVDEHPGHMVVGLGQTEEAQGDGDRPTPLVLRGDVALDAAILRRWASLKLERNQDSSRLVVPAMAPGEYTACWFSYTRFADALAQGSQSGQRSSTARECVDGFLPPYGELDLELPRTAGDDDELSADIARGAGG